MNRAVLLLFGVLACGSARPANAGDRGTITGTIDKPATVTAIAAVDRATDKKFAGKLDTKTGRFTISGLPLGARYALMLDFAGARLEGINLQVPRSDYEEEQPLSKEDIATLKETARSLNKFEDTIDVLTVSGNIQHAAVLLNKLRTKPFYESKPGEIIWRLELWHFERPDETWVKVQDELFVVLYRERLQKKAYDQKSLTLDPALGGLRVTKEKPNLELRRVHLPSKEAGVRLRSDKKPNSNHERRDQP